MIRVIFHPIFISISLVKIYLFCYFICMSLLTVFMWEWMFTTGRPVAHRSQMNSWVPREWNDRQLWACEWALGIKAGSAARATCALKHGAIFFFSMAVYYTGQTAVFLRWDFFLPLDILSVQSWVLHLID